MLHATTYNLSFLFVRKKNNLRIHTPKHPRTHLCTHAKSGKQDHISNQYRGAAHRVDISYWITSPPSVLNLGGSHQWTVISFSRNRLSLCSCGWSSCLYLSRDGFQVQSLFTPEWSPILMSTITIDGQFWVAVVVCARVSVCVSHTCQRKMFAWPLLSSALFFSEVAPIFWTQRLLLSCAGSHQGPASLLSPTGIGLQVRKRPYLACVGVGIWPNLVCVDIGVFMAV